MGPWWRAHGPSVHPSTVQPIWWFGRHKARKRPLWMRFCALPQISAVLQKIYVPRYATVNGYSMIQLYIYNLSTSDQLINYSIDLSIFLSIYPCIYPSIYPSVYRSIYPSIHVAIYLSIYLSTDLLCLSTVDRYINVYCILWIHPNFSVISWYIAIVQYEEPTSN